MNISGEKLNNWNRFAEATRNTAIAARLAYAKGDWDKGRLMLQDLEQAAAAASVSMEAAGADRPHGLPEAAPVPLALLDTPKSRRYAKLMREAYEAAREVDRERGYGEDGPADVLEGFAEDAERDAYGPMGMGEGVTTEDTAEPEALFDPFAREMREVAFSQAQSDTATWGLRSLDTGDIEGVRNYLHILRAGASHKLAVHHAGIPPGSIPFELDQAAQEIGGFAAADPAATESGIRAFLAACEKAKVLVGEMQIVSPYLDSLIFLLEKDIAIFFARQAE